MSAISLGAIPLKKLINKKKDKDVILNRAKDYAENDKKRLKKKARDKEINTEICLNKKKIKREYGKNRYHNMSEEKKQKLKIFQKNYREAKKFQSNN